MQAQVQVQVIHEAPVHDTAVSDKLKLIVEHVGHATYAETVLLEWETCLFTDAQGADVLALEE